jgi:hypothetical protein
MKIEDITKLPTYKFQLQHLDKAVQIVHGFKKLGIQNYIYSFKTDTDIIKFGSSAGSRESTEKEAPPGDRVYRQAGHIPGWKDGTLNSGAGADMAKTMARFFPNNVKDDVTLMVYDTTNYEFSLKKCISYDLEYGEYSLILQHKTKNGSSPKGNIKDMSYVLNRSPIVKDSSFNKFFED